MEAFWTAGIIVSLAGVGLCGLMVLALARQLGMLYVRLGPATALAVPVGPQAGSKVPAMTVRGLDGEAYELPGSNRRALLLFVSATCPACDSVLPAVLAFARAYKSEIDVFVVSSSATPGPKEALWHDRLGPDAVIGCSPELHERLAIHQTPFASLVSMDGYVVSAGVVNTLEHLESLIEIEVFGEATEDRAILVTVDGAGR